MRILIATLGVALLTACGGKPQSEDDGATATPYGTTAEVAAYLEQIGPYVQEIGSIQNAVEQALATGEQGDAIRRGTGRNLAARATETEARPAIQALLARFDELQPPPLLAPFHRDTRKLMALRLEAYEALVSGSEAEQESREYRSYYDEAQEKLRLANQQIQALNREMARITQSLQETETAPTEEASATP
ncbi:hypothetical protein ACFL6X_00915 [Candidatus Latescibacterota bacterium]